MKKNNYKLSALFLLLSGLNLSIMIPGGPVETRVFSEYPTLVLTGFNIYLTFLGLSSLIGFYFLLKHTKNVAILGLCNGIGFEIVYLLDLLKIFPVSPIPMSKGLFVLEMLGTVLAIPLILNSYLAIKQHQTDETHQQTGFNLNKTILMTFVFLVGLSISIIVFATYSAMNG